MGRSDLYTHVDNVSDLINNHRPLSGDEINVLMKDYPLFIGCYSRDRLPTRLNENESLIINLDGHIGSGTHWTCLYNGPDCCEYFDSFGIVPPEDALKLMRKTAKPMTYTSNEIQNPESILCGYYCIEYLTSRYNNIDQYDVLYKYDVNNEAHNDKILIKTLKERLLR
ncbi:MAG: hypothetical protein RBS48_06150 [Ignavibacteriaceae bacterium]|jgi:hypothetical protein|nr:hypothetical protein [Ignavibacteriaceae bacterium]